MPSAVTGSGRTASPRWTNASRLGPHSLGRDGDGGARGQRPGGEQGVATGRGALDEGDAGGRHAEQRPDDGPGPLELLLGPALGDVGAERGLGEEVPADGIDDGRRAAAGGRRVEVEVAGRRTGGGPTGPRLGELVGRRSIVVNRRSWAGRPGAASAAWRRSSRFWFHRHMPHPVTVPTANVSRPPAPSIQKWLAVTMMQNNVASGYRNTATRCQRRRSSGHIATAHHVDQPMCMLGIAAYWLDTFFIVSESNDHGPP